MASEEKFSVEWQIYNKILPEYEGQFRKWIGPLKPEDFKGKMILDAGCGNGRNSFWALKYGASQVIAFDHDKKTVQVAKHNLAAFKNATVYYGTIYNIPFRNKFDIVFSIGVIHHLEKPKLAVKQLIKATKPGGRILIWVYGLEGNENLVLVINAIRTITRFLPPKVIRLVAFFPAVLVYLHSRLVKSRHAYMTLMKNFSFSNIHSIVFDQLLPQIAKYYTKNEALKLMESGKLKTVRPVRVNGNSWAILGIKKRI